MDSEVYQTDITTDWLYYSARREFVYKNTISSVSPACYTTSTINNITGMGCDSPAVPQL